MINPTVQQPIQETALIQYISHILFIQGKFSLALCYWGGEIGIP